MIPRFSTGIALQKYISSSSYNLLRKFNKINPKYGPKSYTFHSCSNVESLRTYHTLNLGKIYTPGPYKSNTSPFNEVFTIISGSYSTNCYRIVTNVTNKSSFTYGFTHSRPISTLKRRKFKIKKHKKKKRKKRWTRMNYIPWKPPSEVKYTVRCPSKVRRIVKERRARNKGNRTLRVPRQR